VGVFFIQPERLSPSLWPEGSLTVICLYVAVSFTVVGNLPIAQIVGAKDTALAQATQPFFGSLGFEAIAIAALFSTASGIDATLYGSARVSYVLAKYREVPPFFERSVWRRSTEGLFITAGLTLLFVNLFDLSGIAVLCSAAILIIYLVVNIAHLRLYTATGANPIIIGATVVTCFVFFGALIGYEAGTPPSTFSSLFIILIACFVVEVIYRRHTKLMVAPPLN
jgi:amino acid transporter